jgi:hypothetical protein
VLHSCARKRTPEGQLDVADIVRRYGASFRRAHRLSCEQLQVLAAVEHCRTARLGGHVDVCRGCGHRRPAYNSCRNRHCPKCQALSQARWIARRSQRLISTAYFHVVFTLPAELRVVAGYNARLVFDMLLRCAAATLLELGNDRRRLGASLGITTVLHTWARDLSFHPHVHCIVTGGGLSADGQRWLATSRKHLFPAAVLGALFRGKLIAALLAAHHAGVLRSPPDADPEALPRLLWRLRHKRWVVYAKRPFAGPAQVLRYLGRYTHRVGLSNQRLQAIDDDGIRFATKDGRSVTLPPHEFLRRWLQHVLPKRFVKIRHWGLLAPCHATTTLVRARALARLAAAEREAAITDIALREADRLVALGWRALLEALTGLDLEHCPHCGDKMQRRGVARAPP